MKVQLTTEHGYYVKTSGDLYVHKNGDHLYSSSSVPSSPLSLAKALRMAAEWVDSGYWVTLESVYIR